MNFALIESEACRAQTETPRLTIAIPTWNRETLLRDQLEVIENHLTADIELVVCDNGSVDGTWDLLQAYARATRHRVRCLRNGVNLGADVNYLRAIELAIGRWVWLVGDDDRIDFGLLPSLLQTLDIAQARVVLLMEEDVPGAPLTKRYVPSEAYFDAENDELGMQILQVGRVLCESEAVRPMLGRAHAVAAGKLHSYGILYGTLISGGGLDVVHLPLLRSRVADPPRWNLLRGHLGAWETALIMYGGHIAKVNAREVRLRRNPLLYLVLEQLVRGKTPSSGEVRHVSKRIGWKGRLALYSFIAIFRLAPCLAHRLLALAKPGFVARVRASKELQSYDY